MFYLFVALLLFAVVRLVAVIVLRPRYLLVTTFVERPDLISREELGRGAATAVEVQEVGVSEPRHVDDVFVRGVFLLLFLLLFLFLVRRGRVRFGVLVGFGALFHGLEIRPGGGDGLASSGVLELLPATFLVSRKEAPTLLVRARHGQAAAREDRGPRRLRLGDGFAHDLEAPVAGAGQQHPMDDVGRDRWLVLLPYRQKPVLLEPLVVAFVEQRRQLQALPPADEPLARI